MPLMLASFHQMRGIRFGQYDASITLVGRRAAQRAGVRHWRRGADPQVRLCTVYVPSIDAPGHFASSVRLCKMMHVLAIAHQV